MKMEIQEQINYWLSSAESDLAVAERLFASRDYHWCLYIGHLVLEKALKAYFCFINNETPPRLHDLVKLAKLSNLELNDEQTEFYLRVTDFNIESRYPDRKFGFYKMATLDYTDNNFNKIKTELQWIKSLITY
ncbi:MAG: HEPN domain-containing protein [bacterium]